ncbi:Na+/H+ antiporter subunit E [Skermania sp. ID1734]|uniref:Na+/H+ antiporter subunit E n=1 Tax=Skermania sp. ID1734 TaxID=2597516 RepID=UPI00118023C5|nr:Na+/H+ antiporter subunit E [Skermania sp. ID1734]TSD99413.1 Na+/H+ antiporter subunit E [Skermania sp. ID1734]
MSGQLRVKAFVLVWLAIVWVWLWGDISWANVIAGLIIGALIMVLLPLPRVPVGGRVHPVAVLKLVVLFAYYAIESSVAVSWLAIRPTPPPETGLLAIPVSIRSDLVLVLFSDVLNMIPGSMVLEIDKEDRLVYIHLLDAGSPAAVARFRRSMDRLERLFIQTFEPAL